MSEVFPWESTERLNTRGCLDSQEQELPLLMCSDVSVATVATNEKGASWSLGTVTWDNSKFNKRMGATSRVG